MGVTAMSSSESKYFKRFGLTPPVEKTGVSPALSINGETPTEAHEVRVFACLFVCCLMVSF